MISHIQDFRDKLARQHRCLGPGITFTDPSVTEGLAESVDFVWIDMEHNPLGFESVLAHLIAARAGGAPALVRVPSSDIAWVKRVLDTGAEGVICPQVQSADEASQFLSACRYPPQGTRGFGPRRPSNYGRLTGEAYLEHANRQVFAVIQIEHRQAVEQLDEILALPGLDSIVVGPYDLSGSFGKLGQLSDPQIVATIRQVVDKARQAGVYVGMGMGEDVDYAKQAFDMGVDWVQCGSDFGYLINFAEDLYRRIRG